MPELAPRLSRASFPHVAPLAQAVIVRSDDAGSPRIRPNAIRIARVAVRRAYSPDMRRRRRNRSRRRPPPARRHFSSGAAASIQTLKPCFCVRLPPLIYLPLSKFLVEKLLKISFISRSITERAGGSFL